MTRLRFVVACLALAAASHVAAQPLVVHGDVIATSGRRDTPDGPLLTTLVVFDRNGDSKGELAVTGEEFSSDPLVRDGIIYFATASRPGIQRADLAGNILSPLTSDPRVDLPLRLSPGPDGGLLATNPSGELYQFAADGTLVHVREFGSELPSSGGIDLASDGCTTYWTLGTSIVRWNACLHTPPHIAATTPGPHTFDTLRLLPDGTFLVAMRNAAPILRLDAAGNVIRNYGIIGRGLALDIDGTSFWTNHFGWITRVDLRTGLILSRTEHGRTDGLAVVGEPRAGLLAHAPSVPAATPTLLAALAVALAAVALTKLRVV